MILSLLFAQPILGVVYLAAIIVAITVHEFSHALAGKLEGDETAESLGRLTLNPIAHLDPWGFVFMVIAGFGWGRPVPFNPYRLKHRRFGPALVSIAGPISNIICALVFGLIYKVLLQSIALPDNNYLMIFLGALIIINAVLAVFNLIPIPPLDGSKLLFALLPQTKGTLQFRMFMEHYGMFLLIGIILLDTVTGISVLSRLFGWVTTGVTTLFM